MRGKREEYQREKKEGCSVQREEGGQRSRLEGVGVRGSQGTEGSGQQCKEG